MNHLKTLIIDDSKAIRDELKILLTQFPQIVFAGEAANIQQAVKLVEGIKPDLIFLDIQLKNESGFDLLEKTDVSAKIIFVTAYNQYAIRAFEVNALDYLLKPVQPKRLKQAIERTIPVEQVGKEDATSNRILSMKKNGMLI
jgi:two-component system LytT family response regulator